MAQLREIHVPPAIVREEFNRRQLAERLARGELLTEVRNSRPMTNPARINAPPGTRSQYVRCYDAGGDFVADVHQFVRADGSLAASGLPDPKRLRVGDEIWIADERLTG